jgi:ABC-2 type transport system ATP-binding protein
MRSSEKPSPARVLSVQELCKQHGDVVAVDGISFDVNPREIVGLLCPNGAGKTTTINMVLGVLEPSSGDISIGDIDIRTHRSQALECAGLIARSSAESVSQGK